MKEIGKKGGFVIHIGALGFMLLLVLVYVFIAYASPSTAVEINRNLANLSAAVQGLKP